MHAHKSMCSILGAGAVCTLGARGLRIFRSSAMLCFFSLYPIRWPQTGICSITGSAHFGHPTRGMPASLPLGKSTHLCFVINDYFMGEVCLNYLNTVSLINLCTYIPSSIFFLFILSFIYILYTCGLLFYSSGYLLL